MLFFHWKKHVIVLPSKILSAVFLHQVAVSSYHINRFPFVFCFFSSSVFVVSLALVWKKPREPFVSLILVHGGPFGNRTAIFLHIYQK